MAAKVSAVHFCLLARDLVQKINQRDLSFDLVIGLSTGGLVAAAYVAKRLGIGSRNVIGLAVAKDHRVYKIDESYVFLGDMGNLKILLVDEASNSGNLLRSARTDLYERGAAKVTTAVMVASTLGGDLPDLYAATCPGEPPEFFWE